MTDLISDYRSNEKLRNAVSGARRRRRGFHREVEIVILMAHTPPPARRCWQIERQRQRAQNRAPPVPAAPPIRPRRVRVSRSQRWCETLAQRRRRANFADRSAESAPPAYGRARTCWQLVPNHGRVR